MEDIIKVKSIINKINRKCSRDDICLSDALKRLEITTLNYLEIIGLDLRLLTSDITKEIEDLFLLKDTRIIVSPNMESLETDEIEIYSKVSPTVVHFSKDKITVDHYIKTEDENNVYEDEYTIISKNDEQIIYNLTKITNKEDLKRRILSQKYPIKHMNIKVKYQNDTMEKSYEFTINHDMLKNDLNHIERLLNNFKFLEAYMILNRYPASIKIIGDNKQNCIK
mgnify:FL=1